MWPASQSPTQGKPPDKGQMPAPNVSVIQVADYIVAFRDYTKLEGEGKRNLGIVDSRQHNNY